MKDKDRWHEWIAQYQIGRISDESFARLEEALATSPDARCLFHRACRMEGALRAELEKPAQQEAITFPQPKASITQHIGWMGAAAAIVLAGVFLWSRMTQPDIVAELVSSENASWESLLPTEPGSELVSGTMKLNSGIATIRFRSGAEMMLEAPAKVTLETSMLAHLESGAVVMNVPESAIGFILETPHGKAIDHGTSFAVSVKGKKPTTFEVIEGEISVVVPGSGEEVRLVDQQGASVSNGKVTTYEGPQEEEVEESAKVLRIGTMGRSYSVIRANKLKWLRPTLLSVRRKKEPSNHERRSFFSFDLENVDLGKVASAQIRLNQVPSGFGYASRLPEVTSIAVYGLTNQSKANWQAGTTWEESPAPEDGVLLGFIELPRSEQRASRVFTSEALLDFLKARQGQSVTFILDSEYDPVTGAAPSLLHAFASDIHPEAAGPMLELTLNP